MPAPSSSLTLARDDEKNGTLPTRGCLQVAVWVLTAHSCSTNPVPVDSNSRAPCADPQSQRNNNRSRRPSLFQSRNLVPSSVTSQLAGRALPEYADHGGGARSTACVNHHVSDRSCNC